MLHDTPLISTIAIGLALAFALGLAAQRVKLPPIAGYLAAGIIVGPFTPGYVADQKLAAELAEIGVILLMFGVGLHFSLKDLMSVRAIAIPGALGQIAVATMMGMALALYLGWPPGAGFLFGLALSVASTVVLLRALQERGQIESEKGRIAVGWLIVEDLVMVLTLVLVPALATLLGGSAPPRASDAVTAALGGSVAAALTVTVGKVALFVLLMVVIGRRIIPAGLHYVAHLGSRELFRLAVMAIALGLTYVSSHLFGVSFALGAFFAGMVLAESELSHQAAKETLPLRDAFAVLFFVSVGMLFNPAILVSAPLAVLATVLIIVLGKSIAAYLIVRAFGHPKSVALTISASLAQIGEFSFILIVLGGQLGIVPEAARDLIVAGAILSIAINPLLFMALDRMEARARLQDTEPEGPTAATITPPPAPPAATALSGHAVVVGHGRVGRQVTASLLTKGVPLVVVDEEQSALTALNQSAVETFHGVCGEPTLLDRLNLSGARYLFSAIPDPYEAGHIVEAARQANAGIWIVARAHSEEAKTYLRSVGADVVLIGEDELARGMVVAASGIFHRPDIRRPRAAG